MDKGITYTSLIAAIVGIGVGVYIAGRTKKVIKSKDIINNNNYTKDTKINNNNGSEILSKKKNICIVTGGSRGIGAAACLKLQAMYKIVCVYNANKAKADEIVEKITNSGNDAVAIQCDVSDTKSIKSLFNKVEKYFKNEKITALVNNAAIIGPTGVEGKLLGMPSVDNPKFESQFINMIKTNVLNPLTCTKLALEKMSKINGGIGGAIVNISSGSAFIQGSPVLYAITKGALNSLQTSIVCECAEHGVRINAIAPGMCNTDMPSDVAKKRTIPNIPLKRLGEASEIADAIYFLLSNQSSYVSGANIRIAGGRPMGNVQ